MNDKATSFLIKTVVGILFLVIIFLLVEDPLNIFDIFDNPGRIQLYLIFGLAVSLNLLYLIVYKIKMRTYQIVAYLIGCFVMCIIFYFMTIPSDNDKNIKTLEDFKVIMKTFDYSISKVNKIDNLDVLNNDIYVAKKDDIEVYYIYNKRKSKINKTYSSFNINSHFDCNTGWSSSVSGGKKILYCEDPSYYKTAYKIKNTMIYAESTYESKDEIEGILYRLGYHK